MIKNHSFIVEVSSDFITDLEMLRQDVQYALNCVLNCHNVTPLTDKPDISCSFCGRVFATHSTRRRHERDRCPERNGRPLPIRTKPARSEWDLAKIFGALDITAPLAPQLRDLGVPKGGVSQIVRRARRLGLLQPRAPAGEQVPAPVSGGAVGALLEQAAGTPRPAMRRVHRRKPDSPKPELPPLPVNLPHYDWWERGVGEFECSLCRRKFRTDARLARHPCDAQDDEETRIG